MALLDAITDAVGNSTDGALREFAAKVLLYSQRLWNSSDSFTVLG